MKKQVGMLGMFLALALICSYVESLIPFAFGVPGMKLGLTNVVVVLLLYYYGPKEAFLVSLMRICLAGFMFGNAFSILYSLAGGLLSWLVMVLLQKTDKFHVISVSICGGICHNLGQIMMAALVVDNYYIFGYFPFLFLGGALTGLLIGIIAYEVYIRTWQFMRKESIGSIKQG
jgi:heptaprenyl diphosphate synthase